MPWQTGPKNSITDIGGLKVGNAENKAVKTGVTALLPDKPAVASVQVLGGAPGARETDLLEPHNMVEAVHALVLAGGSAFGLDAGGGVQSALKQKGIGLELGPHRIPLVPTAILFDLANGGDKDWGRDTPYFNLGYAAAENASTDFDLGTAGAGYGALTATAKGGLGSASTVLNSGITIGALVAVNAVGSATVGSAHHFWAAPFEIGDEFGGLGLPSPMPEDAADLRIKFREMHRTAMANTTIGIIATDAELTKAEAKRLAISAHDGFARALWPSHTPMDGDLIFALATGGAGRRPDADDSVDMAGAAASTMARAVARGVYEAHSEAGDVFPAWSRLSP